jgi:archaellum biogenesis protein FlaJ (TadC family)
MILNFIKSNQSLIIWLTSLSILTFFGTLLLISILLVRMSSDYFVHPRRFSLKKQRHLVIRLIVLIVKNLLGLLFLIAGFIMLFIPGQGLLTIFIGIILLNFPGKRTLEWKLILHPKILPAINSIRQKAGKSPLITTNNKISGGRDFED